MKLPRLSCLSIILIFVLLAMMVGLIGLAAFMPRSTYTPEQQEWLSSNYQRQVMQEAPLFNVYSYLGEESSAGKDSVAAPVATGARESHVVADLEVRYKEREGATVTAYDLRFEASYLVANPEPQRPITLEINFPFPQTAAVLSEATLEVDGSEPPGVNYSMQGIRWTAALKPGQERQVKVHYRAEGVGSFAYRLPSEQRMRDFDLRVTIRGAEKIEIPDAALEPTERKDSNGETALSWRYRDVITNRSVQVELPARPTLAFAQRVERLGEFFMRLALAAPWLTVLFVLFLLALARLESLPVALEHNALLGIGFFLFYPLFIFTAGLLELPLAFVVALMVGGGLVVGFGAWVIGRHLAAIYLIPLLIVFYGFLTRGLTSTRYLGMMLVLSGVVLVALFMWRVGRKRKPLAVVESPVEEAKVAGATPVEEASAADVAPVEEVKPAPTPRAERIERYCIHCGERVETDFEFCPHCGEGAQATRKCARCGLEYIPAEEGPSFCPACGEKQ